MTSTMIVPPKSKSMSIYMMAGGKPSPLPSAASPMAEEEWSGYDDGDMILDFGGRTFRVHRAIVVQASPVWKAMLTGAFAESTGNAVRFDGDDPQVARLCIELMYSTSATGSIGWQRLEHHVMSDRRAFDEFVDKYDLVGVKRVVKKMLEEKHKRLNEKQPSRRKVKKKVDKNLARRWTLVDTDEHMPDVGTRVCLSEEGPRFPHLHGAEGVVIDNDVDDGTAVDIQLDDGRVLYGLCCGWNDEYNLEYA